MKKDSTPEGREAAWSTDGAKDETAETERGSLGGMNNSSGRDADTSDRLSEAETRRANECLDLIAPLSISLTWDAFERRTIVRAMLMYGDLVAAQVRP